MAYTTGNFSQPVTLVRREISGVVDHQIFLHSGPPSYIDLRLRQTGTIPDNATSLAFFANGPMEMIVNGELLHRVDVNETVFPVVDVSRFAGRMVTFDFHVYQEPFFGASFIFDIQGFTQIPEPSTWALFVPGAAGLAWAAHRRRGS